MKNNKIFLIAALLGTTLVACQKEVEIQNPEEKTPAQEKGWTLTVQASKSGDTKAMETDSENEKVLNAYWKNGEKVAVYLGGNLLGTIEVTTEDHVNPATLSGEISVTGVAEGSTLTLLFPGRDDDSWTYLGQDGSALPETFDYATASLTVGTKDDVNHTISATGNATFQNEQSIYRFGFKVGGTGDPIAIKSFIMNASQGQLVQSMKYESNAWVKNSYGALTLTPSSTPDDHLYWMALRNDHSGSADSYSFSVVGSDNALYEGAQSIPANALNGNGKFINAKKISVTQKTMGPNSATIDDPNDVL